MTEKDRDRDRTLAQALQKEPASDTSLPTLAHAQPEDSAPGARLTPPPGGPSPGEGRKSIGPYRLVDRLGQGGMGTVYLADQTAPIKRRVAIKVIRFGMDSREVIARFEAERRTLALMSHPNIAQILDAGQTEDGRPYFVMEYVPGTALNEYCDALRLSLRDRLQLLQEVCHAVQHAHQRGIIHRDLKPSNILVTQDGERPIPKIIDFGIAKATEGALDTTHATQAGAIIGTPEYASPEQLGTSEMDVDSRADVYSLGVVLNELTTGKPPFVFRGRRVGWGEIQRVVREDEPPAPSRLLRNAPNLDSLAEMRSTSPGALIKAVEGELDWIVLRALEKEPGRRYQTPAALAADLRRLEGNEPLEASPPSSVYRLKKLVQRHLVTSIAIMAAVATLLFSGALFTFGLRSERDYARRQAQLAREERDRAVAARDFLLGVVQSANPYQAPNPARRVDVLFEAAARSLAGRFPKDPEMEAQLLQQFGRSLVSLERTQAAQEALERAESLLSGRVPDTNPTLVETRGRLVDLYRIKRDLGRARQLAERQLALCSGNASLKPVTCLAIRNDLIEVTMARGDARVAQNEIEDTHEYARRAGLEGDYEAVFTDYLAGRVLRDLGRTADSTRMFVRLTDRTIKAVSPRHPGLLTDSMWLGWTAYDLGDTDLARRFSEYALAGRKALYAAETRYYFEVVQQRGIIAFASGDRLQAAKDFQFLLQSVPRDDRSLASFRESASAWIALVDPTEARRLDLAALESQRLLAGGKDAPGMAELRLLLSAIALKRGDPAVAGPFLKAAAENGGVTARPYLRPLELLLASKTARNRGDMREAKKLLFECDQVLASQGRRLFDPVEERWLGPAPAQSKELRQTLLQTAERIGDVRGVPF
ncbi:MAG: Serine/threonine-protein kinase PknD [Thermoanaerobaculia bacterium]|nr:Serine/threonine-protein kinase PknD [Thermoanaerobaculia bacterium]